MTTADLRTEYVGGRVESLPGRGTLCCGQEPGDHSALGKIDGSRNYHSALGKIDGSRNYHSALGKIDGS